MARNKTQAQQKKARRRIRSSRKQSSKGIGSPKNPNRYEGDDE